MNPVPVERVGDALISQIIRGRLLHLDRDEDGRLTGVIRWSGNAPEQLGTFVLRQVEDEMADRVVHAVNKAVRDCVDETWEEADIESSVKSALGEAGLGHCWKDD